jgi:hypothetical protein
MSKSAEDKKRLVLIGILIASLVVLGRPYATGHSATVRPVARSTRSLPTFESRRPAPPVLFENTRPAVVNDGSDDDSSLSEIERLLR